MMRNTILPAFDRNAPDAPALHPTGIHGLQAVGPDLLFTRQQPR